MTGLKRFSLIALSNLCLAIFTPTYAGMMAEITGDVETEFGTYHPYPVNIVPRVQPYTIDPDFNNVYNFDKFQFSEDEKALLLENGFVARPTSYKQLYDVYKDLKDRQTPIFVTTDCMLHTFHVLYDNMLRLLEVRRFAEDLDALNKAMLSEMADMYLQTEDAAVKEILRKDVAYLSVATLLNDPDYTVPDYVADLVSDELALIYAHEGFGLSPIFGYREDYSQYVPRGHYTRNERLKRYFRSMMWYGRMMFRLEPDSTEAGIKKGKEETLAAIYLVLALNRINVNGESAIEVWDRIYTPTVFFVGKADDLNIYEYIDLIEKVYGADYERLPLADFADDEKLMSFIEEAKKLRDPLICSSWVWEWEEFKDVTKGFRFMGQRYIPDSHMFTELTHADVRNRLFPMGLDVFSVLGSARAEYILNSVYEQSQLYPDYPVRIDSLRALFQSFEPRVWAQNLYWNWLYTLKPLLFEKGEGYPSFMQSEAWADKELCTALGSWAELRHDTILYAKQSYTRETAIPSPPGLVQGYVEPNPWLYGRLASLANFMRTGLERRGILIDEVKQRLDSLESLLLALKLISEKELTNSGITFDEYELINSIGDSLEALVSFPPEISGQIESDTDDQMALIADVHTDPNTGMCLEVGVGYPLGLCVITRVEGELVVTQGAMFSYYEFKQPMADRLTDEEWQQMLQSGTAPDLPVWTGGFTVVPEGFETGTPYHTSAQDIGLIALKLSISPTSPKVGDRIQVLATISDAIFEGEPVVTVRRPDGEQVQVEMVKTGDTMYVGSLDTVGWRPGEVVFKAVWRYVYGETSYDLYESRRSTILRSTTDVGQEGNPDTIARFYLGQNRPNPFNPTTIISFSIPSSEEGLSEADLTVYDLLGQRIRTLVNGRLPDGEHRVIWDGRDESGQQVSSGIYLYRLSVNGGEWTATRTMVLLR